MPKLRFKDVCKRDMLAIGLPTNDWKSLAADRNKWKSLCSKVLRDGENQLNADADKKRKRTKGDPRVYPMSSLYVCNNCKSSASIALEYA